tara:strand:+ start:12997 stop:13191 length:195 start_codon:yes stop_codon:yes gene_type:complete
VIDMDNILKLIQDIVDRENERNEMLKDSIYADFAFSDETVMAEAMKQADIAIAKKLGEAINGNG